VGLECLTLLNQLIQDICVLPNDLKLQFISRGECAALKYELRLRKRGCAQESAMNVGFAGISGFLVGEQILSRA
jgi:hypothetical protein